MPAAANCSILTMSNHSIDVAKVIMGFAVLPGLRIHTQDLLGHCTHSCSSEIELLNFEKLGLLNTGIGGPAHGERIAVF